MTWFGAYPYNAPRGPGFRPRVIHRTPNLSKSLLALFVI
jgi:hypothetical protein